MRALLIMTGLLLWVFSTAAQPVIKLEDKVKKFEKTRAGEVLSFDYTFENKGDQPLIITQIKVTCDCTKFKWPEKPVPPGGKGTIHVTFDTKSKTGYQDRTLEIISNSKKSPDKIRFKGVVDNPDW